CDRDATLIRRPGKTTGGSRLGLLLPAGARLSDGRLARHSTLIRAAGCRLRGCVAPGGRLLISESVSLRSAINGLSSGGFAIFPVVLLSISAARLRHVIRLTRHRRGRNRRDLLALGPLEGNRRARNHRHAVISKHIGTDDIVSHGQIPFGLYEEAPLR